jgi:transposase
VALHGNAKLTPYMRELMCRRIEDEGWTVAEAAEAVGCSERTCYRWLARWRDGAPMTDRSSAPHHVANRTNDKTVAMIEQLRRLRWTSTKIAAELGVATSTVCAVLTRLGLARRWSLEPPEPPSRYCRRHPGELIHIDVKKLGRFKRPGHRVTGRREGYRRTYKAGWECVHIAIDDTSRLAYLEVLADEKATTCIASLERALGSFADHGVTVERDDRQRQRLPVQDPRRRDRPARDQASTHPALPAAHQRQGRAVHPDHAAPMRLRSGLPANNDVAADDPARVDVRRSPPARTTATAPHGRTTQTREMIQHRAMVRPIRAPISRLGKPNGRQPNDLVLLPIRQPLHNTLPVDERRDALIL